MATVRIAAAKSGIEVAGRHLGRSRDYNIYVDGTKVGTIPNGQKESFVVAAGAHTMLAKTDMSWTSHEHRFDVKENDSTAFHVQPSPNRTWLAVPLALSQTLLKVWLVVVAVLVASTE